VDPISEKFPELTSYQFASNTPIQAIDLDGLEARLARNILSDGTTEIKIILDVDIVNSTSCSAPFQGGDGSLITKECAKKIFDAIKENVENVLSGQENFLKRAPLAVDENVTMKFEFGDVDFYDDLSQARKPVIISLVNIIEDEPGYIAVGQTPNIGNTQDNKDMRIALGYFVTLHQDDDNNGQSGATAKYALIRTFAHELGHLFGLRHPKDDPNSPDSESDMNVGDSPENLMIQGSDGVKLTSKQGATMINNVQTQTKNEK
jgi:predicted Zn-dependent protease